MSYLTALKFAGAKVHCFQYFGSYQGDWYSLVEYKNRIGWISGYYGSCSGCDAFEGEFGFSCDEHFHEDKGVHVSVYDLEDTFKFDCLACLDLMDRLVKFGEGYLDNILTQEEVETEASKNIDWDREAKDILAFLKVNSYVKKE